METRKPKTGLDPDKRNCDEVQTKEDVEAENTLKGCGCLILLGFGVWLYSWVSGLLYDNANSWTSEPIPATYSLSALVRNQDQVKLLRDLGFGDDLPASARIPLKRAVRREGTDDAGWVGWLIGKERTPPIHYKLTFLIGPLGAPHPVTATKTIPVFEDMAEGMAILQPDAMGRPFLFYSGGDACTSAYDLGSEINFTFSENTYFKPYKPEAYHWGWMLPDQPEIRLGQKLWIAFDDFRNPDGRSIQEENVFTNHVAKDNGVGGKHLQAALHAYWAYRSEGSWEISAEAQKAIDAAVLLRDAGDL